MKINKLQLSKTCQTLSRVSKYIKNESRTHEKPLLDAQGHEKTNDNTAQKKQALIIRQLQIHTAS